MSDAQRPQEPVSGDPLLLTPEEAATVLRLGRTTVYALMKAGDLRTSAGAAAYPAASSNVTFAAWKLLAPLLVR